MRSWIDLAVNIVAEQVGGAIAFAVALPEHLVWTDGKPEYQWYGERPQMRIWRAVGIVWVFGDPCKEDPCWSYRLIGCGLVRIARRRRLSRIRMRDRRKDAVCIGACNCPGKAGGSVP